MTPEQFEHCLRYTVEQMKGKGGKCERPCYRDVESLRKATDPNVFYIKFDDMPVLCWDLQLGTLPSLKTGQHRRLGLILKKKIPLPYHPDQEIDEDNKRVSWPIPRFDRAINLTLSRRMAGACASSTPRLWM
jgi:hypothetical protein